MPDDVRALGWARAERASLLACPDHAIGTGQQARVVALTATVATLLRLDGPWTGAIARHLGAVQAVRRLGDLDGQANSRTNLGLVRRLAGDYAGAAQVLEEALGLYHDLGDRGGEAETLNEAGSLHRVRG